MWYICNLCSFTLHQPVETVVFPLPCISLNKGVSSLPGVCSCSCTSRPHYIGDSGGTWLVVWGGGSALPVGFLEVSTPSCISGDERAFGSIAKWALRVHWRWAFVDDLRLQLEATPVFVLHMNFTDEISSITTSHTSKVLSSWTSISFRGNLDLVYIFADNLKGLCTISLV